MTYDQNQAELESRLNSFKEISDVENQDNVADILQLAYALLSSEQPEHYNLCLASICHVADRWVLLDELNRTLLRDCITKSRVFLYDGMINDDFRPSLTALYAKKFYTINKTNTTLTKDQKLVFDAFMEKGRLIVSAPTSFGKTRLLEEIIIAKQYKVAVIVFPTLALLAEQYKRLKSRDELAEYHISTSSKITINKDSKYILMLTPERLSLFMSTKENEDVRFDFFCVDEIYKADQEQPDGRKYFFADAIYRLPKYNPQADFYLIGPYLNSFSARFLNKFNARFMRFQSEVVQKDYFDLDTLKKSGNFKGVTKTATKKDRVIRTLAVLKNNNDSKSLVFCRDKHNTELVAHYATQLKNEGVDQKNNELADYIAESVSPEWNLVEYVRAGVAYHNGNIPRHIQELLVDAFDNKGGEINTLACTTTLIEGVNTNAKNIIFFDSQVADTSIDQFTLKNIEGRAGRLTRHFLGKIYYLDPALKINGNEPSGDMDVELEFFGDSAPTMESALQVEKEDLTANGQDVLVNVFDQASANSVPIELLKSNKFISVQNQINLVRHLRSRHDMSGLDLSNRDTLLWVLKITHDYLFNSKDKVTHEASLNNYLLPKSASYIQRPVSLKQLIDNDIEWRKANRPNEEVNAIIGATIKFYTRYIEYAWPKYLSAFDSIYNFVQFEKSLPKTDFDIIIAKLEYGSAEKHQILLREAGVPFEIIQKIGAIFQYCKTPEDVYDTCKSSNDRIKAKLSKIEYRVLRFYI